MLALALGIDAQRAPSAGLVSEAGAACAAAAASGAASAPTSLVPGSSALALLSPVELFYARPSASVQALLAAVGRAAHALATEARAGGVSSGATNGEGRGARTPSWHGMASGGYPLAGAVVGTGVAQALPRPASARACARVAGGFIANLQVCLASAREPGAQSSLLSPQCLVLSARLDLQLCACRLGRPAWPRAGVVQRRGPGCAGRAGAA